MTRRASLLAALLSLLMLFPGGGPAAAAAKGLTITAYIYRSDGTNSFYWCRSSQVTPVSGGLVTVTTNDGMMGREQSLYDSQVSPANGGTLTMDVDVTGCLANPATGAGAPPPTGTPIVLELESADSDGNRTRTRLNLTAP